MLIWTLLPLDVRLSLRYYWRMDDDSAILVSPDVEVVDERALLVPELDGGRGEDRLHAGAFLDQALVRLSAAREIAPVHIADLLHLLEKTRGHLSLGRSSMRDYAREEL